MSSPVSPADPPNIPTVIPVTNPVTGEVIGAVPRHSEQDVRQAIETARAVQPAWAALPVKARARVLRRFHDIIIQQSSDLYDVLQRESGKSRRDCFAELFAVVSEARYCAYHGKKHLRPHRAGSAIPLRDFALVQYVPVGVVGIIAPWNFPFILTAGEVIPALLSGNAVVLKPATLTPLTACWMRDRFIEAGVPADLLQIVTGPGSEIGHALINHADFIMFTGSSETGRKVAAQCAERLIPYAMELGSKNAAIVLPDANLQHAVQVIIEGSFNNCGQVCINFERLYIHEEIYDRFIEELIRQVNALRIGTSQDFTTDVGSLISEQQMQIVEQHVRDAVEKGATILAGGKPRPDIGPLFYEPTLLANVTPDMIVHSEETFGPVLSVYKVPTIEDAIRLANDTRYGLHFGIATRNRRQARQIASHLKAGTVAINDSYTSWAAIGAPMGGMKDSGVGRRHGAEGIRQFTEAQTVFINRTSLQVSSMETALALNDRWVRALTFLLRIWRHLPPIR
nr:aldehyde dehydrogenase family protein [Anaerolineae bacterium]